MALVVIWVVENGEGGADDAVAFQGQVSVVDERWGDLSPAAVGLFYEVVGNAEFSRPELSDRADGILVRVSYWPRSSVACSSLESAFWMHTAVFQS